MKKPFLIAHWRNLINITYKVPPELLYAYLPKGTNLDVQEGSAFVSLVAFEFLDTKVKGVPIPFHINFPEINLRFYVKYGEERAVCFIREYVPKQAIAFIAKVLYNEPYKAIPMQCSLKETAKQFTVRHKGQIGKNHFSINLVADKTSYTPSSDSVAHYFKEHDIGFGRDKKGNTLYYKVNHDVWEVYPVKSYELILDFAVLYGKKWQFLNDAVPHHVLLAKGSDVAVYSPEML